MTDDIAGSLSSRRARVTPEQAGLPTYGKRRVPGLRRLNILASWTATLDQAETAGRSDQATTR
jgi:hypothetical protein